MATGDVIVVGVDGSDGSRRALRWAIDECQLRAATLLVVHAWQAPFSPSWGTLGQDTERYEEFAQRVLDDAVAEVPAEVPVDKLLVYGTASSVVLEASADATLVVVGSRGRGGFAGLLLGSVGQQVVQHAMCPVVIVH